MEDWYEYKHGCDFEQYRVTTTGRTRHTFGGPNPKVEVEIKCFRWFGLQRTRWVLSDFIVQYPKQTVVVNGP